MRSGRAARPAGSDVPPNTWIWRAKKISGASPYAAVLFLALTVAVLAAIGLDAVPQAAAQTDRNAFITTWETTSDDKSITIPGTGTYTVNWGDGDTNTGVSGSQTHTYDDAGSYTVTITGGLTRINLGSDVENAAKLLQINQWGNTVWTSMNGAFELATRMTYEATDVPDLSRVTDMNRMFASTSFNGDLSEWDTSNVEDMEFMFLNAANFNSDISEWDVSSVTDMNNMFNEAIFFNSDISNWNVSSVTDMSGMFLDATAFNSTISDWDVSGVTDMNNMFNSATSFNSDISNWNVSSVTDMGDMFARATAFNSDISDWDVSSVTDMSDMFAGATSFNSNSYTLYGWNVSSVTDMGDMFAGATTFNSDISEWDVSSVTDMSDMFTGATSFNSALSEWDVSSVTDMSGMFNNATAFNSAISDWDVSGVDDMTDMFDGADAFNQNLGEWYVVLDNDSIVAGGSDTVIGRIAAQNDVLDRQDPTYGIGSNFDSDKFVINSTGNTLEIKPDGDYSAKFHYRVNVTATGDLFGTDNHRLFFVTVDDLSSFATTWITDDPNESIRFPGSGNYTISWGDGSDPDTATGTVSHTYAEPGKYQIHASGDLTAFNVQKIPAVDRGNLVSIDRWGDTRWTSMNSAFYGVFSLRHHATDAPDLSRVTDMSNMFRSALRLNADLSGWDTSSVTHMSGMFRGANDFNGDLSGWNVSRVTDMSNMFRSAMSFNADLSGWNTSSVTDMSEMFLFANDFNGDLSGWNVSGVTDMKDMFRGAAKFNQPLSGWDTSSVTDMSSMFNQANAFNQTLSGWDTSSVTDMSSMFAEANAFNQPLASWDTSGVTAMGGMFTQAGAFNQPLSSWNTSGVTDMDFMFSEAAEFNGDISGWDTSGVTDMVGVFDGATAFNSDISGWDVSGVTDMFTMFREATAFNSDISEWDTSGVTNMEGMFDGATAFNSDISEWDVSGVTNMDDMFIGATAFQQNLGKWYVVPDDTLIARSAVPGIVGGIFAQNDELDGHSPEYGKGQSDDSDHFEIVSKNRINMISAGTNQTSYALNVTASGNNVFENGNNWSILTITVDNDSTSFITTWRTTDANEPVTIPGTGTYTIDWGDGTTDADVSGTRTHEYAAAGTHTVRISGGLERIHLGGGSSNSTNDAKLRSIEQWGSMTWGSMNEAFHGASNMEYHARDAPDLSGVTDMSHMFRNVAADFNGDLSEWDTSNVADMSEMFHTARNFNGDISSWNVSGVTDMGSMFRDAAKFNQPLASWDTSGVTDMDYMFAGASRFNQPLSGWNTSGVTDMEGMFSGARIFDQPLSGWDTSSVTTMENTFSGARDFNQPLSGWDTSSVTDMRNMFNGARAFNQPLSGWDTSSVTDMVGMFDGNTAFNGDISGWDTSSVTNMNTMFRDATAFNSDISEWDVSGVDDMGSMFSGASAFDQNLGKWYVVPDDTSIASSAVPGIVGGIFAQNDELDDHSPEYGKGQSDDSDHFEIVSKNRINMTSTDTGQTSYALNVTASGNNVFENGNNWRTFMVTVGGADTTAPRVASIERHSPESQDTTNASLTFRVTFNELVQNVGAADFETTGTASASVSGITGTGNRYDVEVTAAGTGTVGLALVSSGHGITDGSTNPLTDRTPTGANESYNVVLPADTTAPRVASIERHSPESQDTTEASLTFRVTFSELVQNVGAADFEVTGTASASVSGITGTGNRYDVEVTATGTGTVGLALVSSGHGITDGSMNPLTDRTPTGANESYNFVLADTTPFITTWQTDAADESITFPGTGSYTVDWGDGSAPTSESGTATHEYATAGTHTVSVFGGLERIHIDSLSSNSTNDDKLLSIEQWGDIEWGSMNGAFHGASNMAYSANDAPDLSGVTDMSNMFRDAADFTGNLSGWDTSNVADMSEMFRDASNFNGNISGWDTSNVADMSGMFRGASDFNGDISGWDVSGVTDMSNMFENAVASNFNGDLSGWDTSNVSDMSGMFRGASDFNGNISGWDTSNVSDMSGMFRGASNFSGDISGWDVSSVTDMDYMFTQAGVFNQPLASWDTSSVTDMEGMFSGASRFNQPLASWDTSGVTTMESMFSQTRAFNQPLASWDTSGVTTMEGMFTEAPKFNGNISGWDTSDVTRMTAMFDGATAFNSDISEWDVSSVIEMDYMFFGAAAFNSDLSNWDVSSVMDMTDMFDGADAFNQNLGKWYVMTYDTSIAISAIPGIVGGIFAQNDVLDGHSPTYGKGQSDDSDHFEIVSGNRINMTSVDTNQTSYELNVTASGSNVFENGNNWRAFMVNVGEADTTAPRVASIERYSPTSQDTTDMSLTFRVTFSELVQNVDAADFEVTGTASASVSGITWIGSRYDVEVTTAGTGTVELALVSSGHGITDGSMNSLTDRTPTGVNESYNVVLADTTAPRVASIERYSPTSQDTTETSLTFRVTFSELVQNVGAADFETTGTASASVSGITGTGNRYDVEVTATETGTVGLALVSSDHDITDGSTNPLTDRTPTGVNESYNVVLADTTAPRVASIERYSPTSQDTTETSLTFRVTFNESVQNVDAADFETTGTGTASVSGITGTGSRYDVEVTATGTGTVGLALVSSGHGITDGATNPLTNLTPTGANESYNVVLPADTTAPRVASIERHSPASQDTTEASLTFRVTFSESVQNVDAADFETTGTGTASVSGITGTGNRYDVEVTAIGTGTVGLALVSSGHGITDGSTNPLTNRTPTGANESYNVVLPDDTTAPRVASIERHFPESQDTTDKSLTFRVTFSESVQNVDAADFETTGTASVSGITGTGRQYYVAVTAAGTGTVGLALVSSGHGITDGATNPLTDRTPTGANESYSVMPSDTTNIQPTVNPKRSGGGGGGGGGGSSSGTSLPTVMAPAIDLSTLITTKLASLPQSVTRSLDTFDPHIPLEPARVPAQFDPPLAINGNKYLLGGTTSTLEPQEVMTGEPTEIPFTVYSTNDIEHFSLYLNLRGHDTDHFNSDTRVSYDGGTIRVADRHCYLSSATIAVSEPDAQRPEKKAVRVALEFGRPMGLTNMVAYMQDSDGGAAIVWIIDAIDVLPGSGAPIVDPEPAASCPGSAPAVDPEPAARPGGALDPGTPGHAAALLAIRMWSGFEPESMTDADLLASLGLDYPGMDIPNWVMTELGVLAARGDITVDGFKTALEYVLDNA